MATPHQSAPLLSTDELLSVYAEQADEIRSLVDSLDRERRRTIDLEKINGTLSRRFNEATRRRDSDPNVVEAFAQEAEAFAQEFVQNDGLHHDFEDGKRDYIEFLIHQLSSMNVALLEARYRIALLVRVGLQ